MKVGKQKLPFAELLVFDFLRFLDLYDHFGFGKDFGRGIDDFCAGGDVIIVAATDTGTSIGFDDDVMPVGRGFTHGTRGQADAIFMVFDFFRNANQHCFSPGQTWR